MAAPSLSQPIIHEAEELQVEELRRGPVVVAGMAESGQFSVLWFEKDLLLRRDLSGERKAHSLVRAIEFARGADGPLGVGSEFASLAD